MLGLKGNIKRIYVPLLSGNIEHEPMLLSKPKAPQTPRHVGIKVPKAQSHVAATIMPRYFLRYTLWMVEMEIDKIYKEKVKYKMFRLF